MLQHKGDSANSIKDTLISEVQKIPEINVETSIDSLISFKIDSIIAVLNDSLLQTVSTSNTSSWIDLATVIILGLAAVISFYFGSKTIKDNKRFKEKEWEHSYYELIIINPVMDVTENYIKSFTSLADEYHGKLKRLRAVNKFLKEVTDLQQLFHESISLSFEGWDYNKNNLRNKTLDIVIELEDSLIEYIGNNQIKTDPKILVAKCLKAQGEIYSLIKSCDPYMIKES